MSNRAPAKLGRSGKRLWKEITENYDLRVDELRILEDACREADLVDRLEDALSDSELTVIGSRGQPVASPLISEIRQHRAALRNHLESLSLPDASGERRDNKASRSHSARELAAARWGNRVG